MSYETMKAIRLHDYGVPDALVLEDVPRPEPKADEVLVRLSAAGVNPVDWMMGAGWNRQFMPLQFPWIPGFEGAGVVEAVGADVKDIELGQEVYGAFTNAYANYTVAPASEVFPKPGNLSLEQAATVPMGARTAWQAVIEEADVQPGQTVLIHGGAGGVGLYAVQLAKWRSARVIATASPKNVEFVRSLGADSVIDYTATRFEDVVSNVDAVIDTVGGDVIERSMQVIRPGGIFVTVAGRVDPAMGKAHGIRATSAMRSDAAKLQQISELLAANQLTPHVGPLFPLAQARQAQELSQTRHGRGRIVLLTA